MFLKIKPLRSGLRLEECPKISPQYYDPFAIFLKNRRSGLSIGSPKKLKDPWCLPCQPTLKNYVLLESPKT